MWKIVDSRFGCMISKTTNFDSCALRIRNKDWLAGTTSGSCVPWWHHAFLPTYTWVALNGKGYALMDMMLGTIFSSSLPLVICRRAHVLWCMSVSIVVSNTYRFVFFVCFVNLLLVSCVFALLVQCWQCLWIVHTSMPLRFSLTCT